MWGMAVPSASTVVEKADQSAFCSRSPGEGATMGEDHMSGNSARAHRLRGGKYVILDTGVPDVGKAMGNSGAKTASGVLQTEMEKRLEQQQNILRCLKGEGPTHRQVRRARSRRANQFLKQVLFSAIEEGEVIDHAKLKDMLSKFREEYPGLGSDFDIAQVWGKAYELSFTSPSIAERIVADKAFDLFASSEEAMEKRENEN